MRPRRCITPGTLDNAALTCINPATAQLLTIGSAPVSGGMPGNTGQRRVHLDTFRSNLHTAPSGPRTSDRRIGAEPAVSLRVWL